MKIVAALIFVLFIQSCAMKKETTPIREKTVDKENPLKRTGEIIEKTFVNNNGEIGNFTELYFRASIQDYYIKFCESAVKKEDLIPFIGKVITVDAEIVIGNFDTCPGEQSPQEIREGHYMVIKKFER